MSTQTFPVDGPIKLFVRTGHGSVTVETRDDVIEASVEIQPRDQGAAAVPIAAVLRGTTLHVAGPREGALFDTGLFGGRGRSAVDVHVVVPSHSAVKITTVDAPIRVTGCVDDADIAFGRGRANLDLVDGDLRLRFGQGEARIERVNGSVEIRSGHGQVDLGEVGGDVRGGTGSGDVHVAVARGAVTLRSGAGNARLDEAYGDVELTSGAGDLDVGLPAGVSARLQARTGSGQVRSELPIDDAPTTTAHTIDVKTRTGHGDVRIFRAA